MFVHNWCGKNKNKIKYRKGNFQKEEFKKFVARKILAELVEDGVNPRGKGEDKTELKQNNKLAAYIA